MRSLGHDLSIFLGVLATLMLLATLTDYLIRAYQKSRRLRAFEETRQARAIAEMMTEELRRQGVGELTLIKLYPALQEYGKLLVKTEKESVKAKLKERKVPA